MDSLKKRARDRDFGLFAVPSTMGVISERAQRMFSSGRPMTFVQWYDGPKSTADFVKVVSGLSLDDRIDPPFKIYSGDKLNGPGFSAYLTHVVTFSIGSEIGDTEEDSRTRFNTASPKDVTYVHFTGGREDDWGYDDKIAMTYCNAYGVKMHTIVSFAREG